MSTGAIIGITIGVAIVSLLIGAVAAFLLTKKLFEKQLRENPPINEKMIRAMFSQMGRKPSESQIRNIMRSMTNAK